MLLRLGHVPGELHIRTGELLQLLPLGAVTDDHEPATGDRPDPLPELEQKIDALVVDQPAERQEERGRGPFALRQRLLDAVVHQPYPLVRNAQLTQAPAVDGETAIIRWSR
ncbi:hypothetical protein SVIOM74S_04306 [Streptomyces violarus]